MRTICVIPARMASTRFPGKPLVPILGLPMLFHIYERCRLCSGLQEVVIATCDEAIRVAAEQRRIPVVMTADTHPGCVDRTDEAIRLIGGHLADDDMVLMVQGDEIMVAPDMLDGMVDAFAATRPPVVNLASRIRSIEDHDDANCVKVVADARGRALFFSRSPIPSRARIDGIDEISVYQQTGVIGFAKAFVRKFGELPQTPLEKIERIDMLRVIEHGLAVQLVFTDRETVGVDTPADRDRVERLLRDDPLTARYLARAA